MSAKYQLHQLAAQVTPSTMADKRVTYVSSNPSVATCDGSGVVEIFGNGTTTITATSLGNGLTDTCVVTVNVSESKFWIGSAAKSYAGGDGTKGNPWKIATPEQLARLARNSRLKLKGGGLDENEYFELTADIDLAGKDWVSIGWYQSTNSVLTTEGLHGHFNGNGHVIKNMVQGSAFSGLNGAEGGLFSYICGEVKNLGIVDADQKGREIGNPWFTGIMATYAKDGAFEGCFTTGKTLGSSFILNLVASGASSGSSTAKTPTVKNTLPLLKRQA
jgi:hypothetical protein